MRRYFLIAFAITTVALSAHAESPEVALRGTADVFSDNALFDDELLGGPIRPSETSRSQQIVYDEYTDAVVIDDTPVTYAAHDIYVTQRTSVAQETVSSPNHTKDGRPLLSWSGR